MNAGKIIILVILVGMLSSGLTYLFCLFQRRKIAHQTIKNLQAEVTALHESWKQSSTVLEVLEFGILAYAADGSQLAYNSAAKKILNEVPGTYSDFMDKYGEIGNIRSSLLLGSRFAETKLERGTQCYLLRVREQLFEGKRKPGHVVMLQDISVSEQEELQRKQFVANVSHELKTPLTTVKSYTESLLDWGISEKTREAITKDVQRIYDDSIRMEKLIDDLLLLSRIDGKGFSSRTERVDLAIIVKSVTERMRKQAKDKAQELVCHIVNQGLIVYMDRQSMERVLTNLLSNAIKYTPEQGEIHVYVGSLIDDVYVKVRDSGIGIPEQEIARIFDRFYRVDNTGSRLYGGTGLGLSIVKELVELHGGDISVRSKEHEMSEFTVILPGYKKSLRNVLYNPKEMLVNPMITTQAVIADLEAIAQRANIVAKWDSLQGVEQDALMEAIEDIQDF